MIHRLKKFTYLITFLRFYLNLFETQLPLFLKIPVVYFTLLTQSRTWPPEEYHQVQIINATFQALPLKSLKNALCGPL